MNATLTDAEKIAEKINGYIQGCESGEGVHFKAAFHPDARMFGHVGPDRYDDPIFGGMDVEVANQPVGQYDTRILSIDISGDAAAVKLAESRFWGQDFINFFLLSRIDDEWHIVAKAFDHVGPTS
jgi:hypothetical protein